MIYYQFRIKKKRETGKRQSHISLKHCRLDTQAIQEAPCGSFLLHLNVNKKPDLV
jgi:hypothetical protein